MNLSEYYFVIHPGMIYSADGDAHYISYERLIQLYRVPRDHCVRDVIGVYVEGKKVIHLRPDDTGKYSIEDVILNQLLEIL
jgi:hypothetical protein